MVGSCILRLQELVFITKVRQCKFYGFAFQETRLSLTSSDWLSRVQTRRFIPRWKGGGKKNVSIEFEGEIIPFQDIEELDEQKRFFKFSRGKP